MYVYLNGKLLRSNEAMVSVFDHGFLYGDGIYETMRAYNKVVFMLDEHLRRLYRSASFIGLTIPMEKEMLKTSIYETLTANSLRNAYVRLAVSRGYGPIGLDPDICERPTIVIIAQQLKEHPSSFYEEGIRVVIAETRRNPKEAINPLIKSMNFLNNILAKMEAKRKGAYEAIMLNIYGKLAEGTTSNLFFYRDGILCTPSIDCGILDGITRGVVMYLARRDGLNLMEGEFTKEDLYSAEEVFITSTTFEVMPVSMVDDKKYSIGEVTKLLHKAYREEVNAYIAKASNRGGILEGKI